MAKTRKPVVLKQRKPSINKEKACEIIFAMMVRGNSLRKILGTTSKNGLPGIVTFMDWLKEDETMAEQYARAQELRSEHIFEEIKDISDKKAKNMVEVTQARLKVDSRKWMLGKMQPKKYGDRVIQSGDPDNPIAHTITGMEIK